MKNMAESIRLPKTMKEVVDFIEKWFKRWLGVYSVVWDGLTTESFVTAKHILTLHPALNTLANHGNIFFQGRRLSLTNDVSLKVYYHMMGRTLNSKKWVKPYEIHKISHQHIVILFLVMQLRC